MVLLCSTCILSCVVLAGMAGCPGMACRGKVAAAVRSGLSNRPFCRVMSTVFSCLVPGARASCVGAVLLCSVPRPALWLRCRAVRCLTSLVRSDPGVGMSIFFPPDVQSAVLTYARCPGLVRRSRAAVCCRLCWAASAVSSRPPRGFAVVPMSARYSVSRLMSVMLP